MATQSMQGLLDPLSHFPPPIFEQTHARIRYIADHVTYRLGQMMPDVGLYNVEVLVRLKYSLIAMITCSVGAEIASVLKTLNNVFLDL